MGSNSVKARTPVARVLVILSSLGFIVAGILMIIYFIKLNNSGWLDVFDDELQWIRTTLFACVIALGSVLITIALMGCCGASFKQRGILCCYNIFVVLAFILLFVVMALAFASMAIANNWAGKAYPAAEQEPMVAENFNRVYCLSEAAYLCTSAPFDELIKILIPGIPSAIVSMLEGKEGINSLCEDKQLIETYVTDQKILETITNACDECAKAAEYEQYEAVFEWVDEQCPLFETGPQAIKWCGDFLIEGTEGDEYEGAPYGACRPKFLGLWSDTSKTLGIALLCILLFLLVVIVSTCIMMRRRGQPENDEKAPGKNPNNENPGENHPQTQAQVSGQNFDATVY